MKNKALIFALLAILSWSTAATAFKIALRELTYFQLLYFSTFVASVVLFLFIVKKNKLKSAFSFSKRQFANSLLAAILNPIAYYLILLKAYTLLPAQIAQPLNYTWPLVLVVISSFFLKQKLKLTSVISLLISLFGVLVISTQGNLTNLNIKEPLGVILASGSAIIWAFYWIVNMKDKRDELIKVFLSFFFAFIVLSLYVIIFAENIFIFELNSSLWAAVYVGFFELAFPFVLWLTALSLVEDNAKISNLVFLSPFLSLIFIHYILGEEIYYTTILGLFFILGGIALSQKKGTPKPKNQGC